MAKRVLGITLFISSIILLSSIPLLSQEVNYPAYSGYINDYAGIISESDKVKANNLLSELEQKTTAQVAIATLSTTAPLDISTYAVELFQHWGIGQKNKDNGLLLLIATKDRKVRIEVGYGLEGALPDAVCNQIIYKGIIPLFKNNRYSQGVLTGVNTITDLIAREYDVELTGLSQAGVPIFETGPASRAKSALEILFSLIFFILIFGFRFGLFGFLLLNSGRRRGGHWFGGGYSGNMGGFSGGFGGFGGGLSGGGGACGSW
ncbi:MAG: TPM domain-containing protein [Candidatus Omnitrophota bacterium]|nr:TPM domain-containing protein [Candidatus Omnitrophota bacterium]